LLGGDVDGDVKRKVGLDQRVHGLKPGQCSGLRDWGLEFRNLCI
jgi:hypothetical protein